jgi:UDP-3-O-[3-hydroxymyristoyl] glucosamine N-acyltransferase
MFDLKNEISSLEVAKICFGSHSGPKNIIHNVAPLGSETPGSVCFSSKKKNPYDNLATYIVSELSILNDGQSSFIKVSNPRYAMALLLNYLINEKIIATDYETKVAENCQIAKSAIIEDGVTIEKGVSIGDNSVIKSGTHIKENSQIESGSVIGGKGFGYVKDENRIPIFFPHIGRAIIGEGCAVGDLSIINRGSLSDTLIMDYVKIDQNVHVAHNVIIGTGSLLCSGAVIGGSSKIGANCFVGINATIRDGIVLGNDVTIGMGVSVIKNVRSDSVVSLKRGYPGRKLT